MGQRRGERGLKRDVMPGQTKKDVPGRRHLQESFACSIDDSVTPRCDEWNITGIKQKIDAVKKGKLVEFHKM